VPDDFSEEVAYSLEWRETHRKLDIFTKEGFFGLLHHSVVQYKLSDLPKNITSSCIPTVVVHTLRKLKDVVLVGRRDMTLL
jgi:hypothetical protein